MNLLNKKVLVIGMKSSGISVSNLLLQNGARVYGYDDGREKCPGNVSMVTEITADFICSCDLIVPSPSISPTHPAIEYALKYKIKILGELEIACMFLDCKKIMVTGTNGKTTVVNMIEKLLLSAGFRAKAMGNIGYPVSQVVLDGTRLDYAVIEVSSFQLEYIRFLHPDMAVVLNLAPDHMDRYKSFSQYVATKEKIISNQTEDDLFFFNCEDGAVRKFLSHSKAYDVGVGLSHSVNAPVQIKDNYFMNGDESVCAVKCCKLRGEHNKLNLLFSLNVGYFCGCKNVHFTKLIKEYTLLPNRIEYVVTMNGVAFYNDSKGTNIHATKHAIGSMDGNIGLIMGGSSKNEDFCEFFENIDEKVKYVALTGDNADQIFNSAMKMGYTDISIFDTLRDTVLYLYRLKGITTVLLSPASASFDRYKNYSERGEKFKEIVYALKK